MLGATGVYSLRLQFGNLKPLPRQGNTRLPVPSSTKLAIPFAKQVSSHVVERALQIAGVLAAPCSR